jgi:hypothetical protein
MTKMKEINWFAKPQTERVAAVLWPALTTDENRKQMQALSDEAGKKSPQQIADELRNKR